jgi:anti-sigma B factor antagonist
MKGPDMSLTIVGAPPARVAEIRRGQEVAVSGRLDVHTVAKVRLALHDILGRGTGDLLIHLAGAEVHDATGLGVIVGAHHHARRAGRRLVLVDVSPRLDRLVRASRLQRVLARELVDDAVTLVPVSR